MKNERMKSEKWKMEDGKWKGGIEHLCDVLRGRMGKKGLDAYQRPEALCIKRSTFGRSILGELPNQLSAYRQSVKKSRSKCQNKAIMNKNNQFLNF